MDVEIKDFVGVFRNAYSKEFCAQAIEVFDEAEKMGLTVNRQQNEGAPRIHKHDTSLFIQPCQEFNAYNCRKIAETVTSVFWNSVYPAYSAEFDALSICSPHGVYTVKVQKTPIGGGYHVWHLETGSRETANRLMAYVLYLNDVDEGGETEFLYYPRRIKPEAGTLVLFPGGYTHTHRGNPPISGAKYIVTGWVEY